MVRWQWFTVLGFALAFTGCAQTHIPQEVLEASGDQDPAVVSTQAFWDPLIWEVKNTVIDTQKPVERGAEVWLKGLEPIAIAKTDTVAFTDSGKFFGSINGAVTVSLAFEKIKELLGATIGGSLNLTGSASVEYTYTDAVTFTVTRKAGQGWRLFRNTVGSEFTGRQTICLRFPDYRCETKPFIAFVPTGVTYREQYYDTAGWCKYTPPHGGWWNFKAYPPPGGIKEFPVYLGGPQVSVVTGVYAKEGWYSNEEAGLSVRGGWIVYQPLDSTKCDPFDVHQLENPPK
jgi:hypothetical protein